MSQKGPNKNKKLITEIKQIILKTKSTADIHKIM